MKTLAITVLFCISLVNTKSQSYSEDTLAQQNILKLSFLTGQWEGEGWMMGQDRTRHEFKQIENIRLKLNSTALLIEGQGKSDGRLIHDALAIVRYNKAENDFSFNSYLSSGREGKFKAELIDGKFYWFPNEQMRYIISINNKGQWFETGEMKRGEEWFQFFEMTLNKIDN